MAAERRTQLAELQARQKEQISGYELTDTSRGIVRIPINRAMELIVQEHSSASRVTIQKSEID